MQGNPTNEGSCHREPKLNYERANRKAPVFKGPDAGNENCTLAS